jgi:hypothetical protein
MMARKLSRCYHACAPTLDVHSALGKSLNRTRQQAVLFGKDARVK